MTRKQPSPNGVNGRDSKGRFAPGNAGGPGNPRSAKVAALRTALIAAVSPQDIQAIVRKLLAKARAGDVIAAREILDRAIGRPTTIAETELEMELQNAIDRLNKIAMEKTTGRGQISHSDR